MRRPCNGELHGTGLGKSGFFGIASTWGSSIVDEVAEALGLPPATHLIEFVRPNEPPRDRSGVC